MFKKNHVGRPSNEELRKRRNKKILLFGSPIILVVVVITLVATGSLSKLSGNSVTMYYCGDSEYKYLEGTNCYRYLSQKAALYADINLDDLVDNKDLNLLNDYVKDNSKVNLSEFQMKLADINEDGMINEADVQLLESYFTGNTGTVSSYIEIIGVKRVCDTDYELKGDMCEKKDPTPIPADKKVYNTVENNANETKTDTNQNINTESASTTPVVATFKPQDSNTILKANKKYRIDINFDVKDTSKDYYYIWDNYLYGENNYSTKCTKITSGDHYGSFNMLGTRKVIVTLYSDSSCKTKLSSVESKTYTCDGCTNMVDVTLKPQDSKTSFAKGTKYKMNVVFDIKDKENTYYYIWSNYTNGSNNFNTNCTKITQGEHNGSFTIDGSKKVRVTVYKDSSCKTEVKHVESKKYTCTNCQSSTSKKDSNSTSSNNNASSSTNSNNTNNNNNNNNNTSSNNANNNNASPNSKSTVKKLSCPSGYKLSGTKCVKTIDATKTSGYACPSNYELNGTKCIQKTIASTKYTCPSGYTPTGLGPTTSCVKKTYGKATTSIDKTCSYSGSTSGEINWTKTYGVNNEKCIGTYNAPERFKSCPSGYKKDTEYTCVSKNSTSYECPSGYKKSSDNKRCSIVKTKQTCPTGYTASGNNCVKNEKVYKCPSGWTLDGKKCVTTETSYSCPSGYSMIGGGSSAYCQKCSKAYKCPSGYTLSGKTCKKSYNATKVPGTSNIYACSQGGTRSGKKCNIKTSATLKTSCVTDKTTKKSNKYTKNATETSKKVYTQLRDTKKTTETIDSTPKYSTKSAVREKYCPSGELHESVGQTAYCLVYGTKKQQVTYGCESGYKKSGSGASIQCYKEDIKAATPSVNCPVGSSKTVEGSTTYCVTEKAATKGGYTCPSGYTLNDKKCISTQNALQK